MKGKILILILISVFCLFSSCPSLAQEEKQTEKQEKIPSSFALFWQDVKETIRILFAWDNVEKVKLALDIADRKLEDYKKYRLMEEDKLAGQSLKGYKKEIDLVLDVLEKETDQEKAEQIACETKDRVMEGMVELEELYYEAPEPLKEIISKIISSLQNCYEVSYGIMSGEYQEEIQGWFKQSVNWLEETMKKIYYKLWPVSKEEL